MKCPRSDWCAGCVGAGTVTQYETQNELVVISQFMDLVVDKVITTGVEFGSCTYFGKSEHGPWMALGVAGRAGNRPKFPMFYVQ